MQHARTIAMASTLLADGRAEDVESMVDPLLDPVTAPAASTGQILLRGLLARVAVVHRENPSRALELLPEVKDVSALCTCVRAEVALWRGWAFVRGAGDSNEVPKAARLLRNAQELFASIHDPLGRCWALLGRTYAYTELGEYTIGSRLLDRTAGLVDRLRDNQVERWYQKLRTPALQEIYSCDRAEASTADGHSFGDAWEMVKRQSQWRFAKLKLALHQSLAGTSRSEVEPTEAVEGLVAESSKMETVVDQIQHIHPSHSPILLTGEAGTGKRLVAEAIHRTSPRAEGPLRHISCAPMQQEGPLEARLFGSANGAAEHNDGAVEAAEGGTLVIENVDALPRPLQSSLLQLIGPATPRATGSSNDPAAGVRIVATTTADLDALVEEGRFQPELRDRLSLLSVQVPPLRQRRADIPLLVRHFVNTWRPPNMRSSERVSVTQPAMEALLRYNWPGNVRQLHNEIERALVYVQSEPAPTIGLNVLSDTIVENARRVGAPPTSEEDPNAILEPDQTLSDVLSRTEKTVIERVLRACDGQITASADVLGLTRQGLYKKMKRLEIDASALQSSSEAAPASS